MQLMPVRDITFVPAHAYEKTSPLSPLHHAALVYTDYMTRFVKVPKNVFDELRSHLENDQQIFEATATIAAYNTVSRILVALNVGDKADTEVPDVIAA